jgi:hypothetical protein
MFERVVLIDTVEKLNDTIGASYQRIYFGAEFCEHLMPNPRELRQAIDWARVHKRHLSLMTPYMTDAGIKKARGLLSVLNEYAAESQLEIEVVVNDYGALHLLMNESVTKVIGRGLSKQRRDPRLRGDDPCISGQEATGHQYSLLFLRFLCEHGIYRVEFDREITGASLPLIDASDVPIHYSVYASAAYVTTTRLCHYSALDKGAMRSIESTCERPCKQMPVFELWSKTITEPLVLKGNTLFFSSSKKNDPVREQKGIDRVIYDGK